MRWFIVLLLGLLVFNALVPWLQKWGLGKLPGDFSFRFRGRLVHLPLGTSVVFSFLMLLISKLL
jgi:hypothetical protein